jgi:hypothetical protein
MYAGLRKGLRAPLVASWLQGNVAEDFVESARCTTVMIILNDSISRYVGIAPIPVVRRDVDNGPAVVGQHCSFFPNLP